MEPESLELSEELLRMDAEERRRLELKAMALMQAQIEAMPPVVLFYRPKA